MRLGLGLGINRGRKNSGGDTGASVVAALESQATTDGYTAFSGTSKTAGETMVDSLIASGIWDKLDLFYVFATNGDENFAKYNWKNPSTFACTETGAGALTFTSLEGFTGDGTNYLSTGWNPSTDAINFALSDASFGVYSRTAVSTVRGEMGQIGGFTSFLGVRSNNAWTVRLQSNTGYATAAVNTSGLLMINRNGSDLSFIRNGSEVSSTTESPLSSIESFEWSVMRVSNTIGTKQLSVAFSASDLSLEASDFYNAVQTYMTAIGSAV